MTCSKDKPCRDMKLTSLNIRTNDSQLTKANCTSF
ncbi:unnamed protein product, partial [Cuscuta epithymum]